VKYGEKVPTTPEDKSTINDSSQHEATKNTSTLQSKSILLQPPSISLPKGGGAIRSIDKKFSVNAINGTAAFSLPIPFSEARGLKPALSLSYNSGEGTGEFGMAWSLRVNPIKRKTE